MKRCNFAILVLFLVQIGHDFFFKNIFSLLEDPLHKNQSSNFVSQIHFSTSGKWMTLQSNLWVPFVICYQIVISFSASTSSIRETQTYSHHHHHDLFSFFHYYNNAENFLTKDKAKYVKKISSTTTFERLMGQ